ncbi:uncharacterized protein LOC110347269 isoform X3 [Heterocephalus glaber]|uniref:Uncharacterized protein LOC110347269 isoform X3 n=1 Tax=Heterocephalus glaber TaxID=10181 RepID=A0AAX6SCY7_HETGA|nr:uncharacterized protein LOC110347269 isoform X3 [Heterocephalus glaber]
MRAATLTRPLDKRPAHLCPASSSPTWIMLRLLPALVLLGVLVTPEGTSKTCPACASPGHCRDILCPSAQDSCLLSQMQLENGTVVDSGSCVAPGRCRESITTLTYGPNSTLWVSTACCANSCSITGPPQEPGPEANHVTCQYCSGNKSAPCDSLSVMNCTGNQTKCVTLNGTWSGGPHAAVTHTNPKPTICFTCSDLQHCDPLPCPEDRNYCLQTAGITAFGDGNSFSWRNGSCVASTDCTLSNSISGLTYGIGLGFWVNTTCCQGNCQEPTRLATLPASRTLTKFLCPTCPKDQSGSCRSSFYLQCPRGETQCVQLDLTLDEGGQNVSMRGCGSRDLCSSRAVTEKLRTLSDLSGLRRLRLSRRPNCNPSRRAVLENQCLSSAAGGLRLALPLLAVALGAARLC